MQTLAPETPRQTRLERSRALHNAHLVVPSLTSGGSQAACSNSAVHYKAVRHPKGRASSYWSPSHTNTRRCGDGVKRNYVLHSDLMTLAKENDSCPATQQKPPHFHDLLHCLVSEADSAHQ